MGGIIHADDSVSAAFTFDARYPASGLSPADWEAYEAVGMSERFGTGEEIEYVPPQGNASMFFKVSVRLSDDYGK